MSPAVRDGEMVYVKPASEAILRRGDIVLVKGEGGFRLHRLIRANAWRDEFITRGDCGQQDDPAVRGEQILGVAVAKDVQVGRRMVRAKFRGIGGRLLRTAARGQSVAGRLARLAGLCRPSRTTTSHSTGEKAAKLFGALGLLLVLLTALHVRAQVAVDAETNSNAEYTGIGTKTLAFNHTTTGTNLLLLVGVSINITNAPGTVVSSVTYDNVALSLVGAQNDAGATRRVEIWSLLAPPTGTHAVDVNVSVTAAATVGVTAGAISFKGVDQTVPLGTFVSANGAAGTYSDLNVPGVVNGMVLDTLATGGDQTVTIPGPQTSQWNTRSGNASPPDVTGSGSSRTGAPSVPVSETFNGTSNWSLGAVSIDPTAADIGVTTSVGSAVFLGQSTTYTITIFNNGTSTANTVKLSDTLATGMTLGSVTPSIGTCVTTA
ncbi:MAG: hypothetical protein WAM69_06120, partial [Candidatus Sulfotelmatobacter sp.]